MLNVDRFKLSEETYQGGLPHGNTGNILLAKPGVPKAIDTDVAVSGPLSDEESVGVLAGKFAPYLEALKTGKYDPLINGVLESLMEFEHVEEPSGLTERPVGGPFVESTQAKAAIARGIDAVNEQVRSLKDKDLETIANTWKSNARAYGDHLIRALRALGAEAKT